MERLNHAYQLRKLVLVVAGATALAAQADVAGLPEEDPRVVIYRTLQSEFIREYGIGLESQPMCDEHQADWPEVRLPNGKYRRVPGEVPCQLLTATGCQSNVFPPDRIYEDGTWLWAQSRIGYLWYLRHLAHRASVPDTVGKVQLDSMERSILQHIAVRMKQPARLRPGILFDTKDGLLSRAELDHHNDRERMNGLERAFAASWNHYVLSLPEPRRRQVPTLVGLTDECGEGAFPFILDSNPPGGKIRLISDLDALLCEALKRDPWDVKVCQGWSAVASKDIQLSGTYRFVVDWPDGKRATTKLNLEHVVPDTKVCIPQACP